ncbi:MAG TPA: hypothetical protein VGI91_10545 [Steroidobacteraceae bacterium]
MKFRSAVLCLAAIALLFSGCKSLRGGNSCNKKQPYQKAASVAPLTVPAGLTGPETSAALKLPPLKEPGPPPRTTKDPCLDTPPSYKVAKPPPPPQA